jgi:hypothetical protein
MRRTAPSHLAFRSGWTSALLVATLSALAGRDKTRVGPAPDTLEGDWTREAPLPTGVDLYGVWVESESSVLAAGESGRIFRFDGD